ncbi:MAG: hypothetical protein AB8D52_06345 [Gammaproteobacteria bacterium]
MNRFLNLKCLSFLFRAFLIVTILNGCSTASTDPVRVESDFGNSVKNMVDAQIIDHDAANTLVVEPVIGIDGISAEKILLDHRSVESNAEEVDEPIDLDIE